MSIFLVLLTVLMAVAIGWSIGANDAANSLGVAVGSRVLNLRQAIILITVFGFLGAFLQGSSEAKTIAKGIVPMEQLDENLALYVALVSVFAAAAWVVIATRWKIPISTSHSIVGAVAGAGIAVHSVVRWKVLLDIFTCWLLTPIGAAVLGYIFYRIFKNIFYRLMPRRFVRGSMIALIIASGCYVALLPGGIK